MHTSSSSHHPARPSRLGRFALVAFFTLLPALLCAAVNHRPTIGYVPNQRNATGTFTQQTVTISDDSTAPNLLQISAISSSGSYPISNVGITNNNNGTITLGFEPTTTDFTTTITLTVTDNGSPAKSSSTAFTLQRQTTDSKISLQRIPDWTMPVSSVYGPVTFAVVDDSTESTLTYTKTVTSNNANLLPDPINNIAVGGQSYGRTVTVTPAASQSGRATITITAKDSDNNTTSTAFVLDVVSGNTSLPTATLPATYYRQNLPATSGAVSFTVSDSQTPLLTDLRVTAVSSNPALVPNLAANLSVAVNGGGNRTVNVMPTADATGATTITLDISDGDITRQAQFLYVVYDEGDAINTFARSSGVFVLDSPNNLPGETYTPQGITVPPSVQLFFRDGNLKDVPYATGFTIRLSWAQMEDMSTPAAVPADYDFQLISNILAKLEAFTVNPNQKLSIIIMPDEPQYIATTPGVVTWLDDTTSVTQTRAVPWDGYLLSRFQALVEAMADFEVYDAAVDDMVPFALHSRLAVVHAYLPGGSHGLRDPHPEDKPLSSLPDYINKENLLATVKQGLNIMQDNFPGKCLQLGFWKVEDPNFTDVWDWYRTELLAEYNDSIRPRIGFFMDNLAAKRAVPAGAYTASPGTGFGAPLALSNNNTWGSFQMLGNWVQPFNDNHVTNTLNGTPHEAMEFAYGPKDYTGVDSYNSRYTEVYYSDTQNAAFRPMLQGWHDFLATLAAPVGLMAGANAAAPSTQIDVTWIPVPGATSYKVQRRTVGGTFGSDITVNAPATTYTYTGLAAGTEYHFRVNATTATGTTAYAASFPATTATGPTTVTLESVAADDGWVLESTETSNQGGSIDSADATTSALRVGDATSDRQYKLVVSFATSSIPDNATILSATLKLKRGSLSTGGTNPFTTHGSCKVDIVTGSFGGAAALANGDFQATATATAVATMSNPATNGALSTGSLNAAGRNAINKTGKTQLRVAFDIAGGDNDDGGNDYIGFYSGNNGTAANRPVLEITYQ